MNSKTTIWSNNTVIPPSIFECVVSKVYRSNVFSTESFQFISSLNLKSIVYLAEEKLNEDVISFCDYHRIKIFTLDCRSVHKDDWKPISEDNVKKAIEYILNPENVPVLVMCKDGVKYSGIVIACLRKCFHWCFTSIIQEVRSGK